MDLQALQWNCRAI